jgi:hypothetical protein
MVIAAVLCLIVGLIFLVFGDILVKQFMRFWMVGVVILAVLGVAGGGVGGVTYWVTYAKNAAEKQLTNLNPIMMYQQKILYGQAKIDTSKKYLVDVKTSIKNTEDDILSIDKKIASYETLIKSNKDNKKLIERYAKSVLVFERHKVKKQEALTNYKVSYDEFLVKIEESEERLADAKVHLEDLQFQLEQSDNTVALATIDVNMPDFSDFELMEKEIASRINRNEAVLEVAQDFGQSQPVKVDNSSEVSNVLARVLNDESLVSKEK